MQPAPDFLAGVIEGFYGQPWGQSERLELFDWMAAWGLNTYLYAPKDDLKHRAIWRQPYTKSEAEGLTQLIQGCRQRGLRFIYALSPGLDIQYGAEADMEELRKRCEQMIGLGCENLALLFDDIPDRLSAGTIQRWGSLASAQCHVANQAFQWFRQRCSAARFLFCPTAYCGRMVERKLGGEGYLNTVGRELLPEIDVFWTGPEIISREITLAHVREVGEILRRKPLIWDNLHANDYDGRRFFCGPYAGRPPALREAVSGLLSNPNCEFPLNYVPIRTLAQFVRSQGEWDAREAYRSAIREWLPRFETVSGPVDLEDVMLLGDCYYLPHEDGPEAEALYQAARSLLDTDPAEWGGQVLAFRQAATRLREFCAKMTELRQRPLFYALSRRLWDLREELDLLDGCIQFRSTVRDRGAACRSDFHLPGTFRGGMVARLQRLLVQHADGTFTFVPGVESAGNRARPERNSAA